MCEINLGGTRSVLYQGLGDFTYQNSQSLPNEYDVPPAANPDGSEVAVDRVRRCDTSEGDSKVVRTYR